jgi:hypothetical protein
MRSQRELGQYYPFEINLNPNQNILTLKGNSSLERSNLERPKNRLFWSQKNP